MDGESGSRSPGACVLSETTPDHQPHARSRVEGIERSLVEEELRGFQRIRSDRESYIGDRKLSLFALLEISAIAEYRAALRNLAECLNRVSTT